MGSLLRLIVWPSWRSGPFEPLVKTSWVPAALSAAQADLALDVRDPEHLAALLKPLTGRARLRVLLSPAAAEALASAPALAESIGAAVRCLDGEHARGAFGEERGGLWGSVVDAAGEALNFSLAPSELDWVWLSLCAWSGGNRRLGARRARFDALWAQAGGCWPSLSVSASSTRPSM